MQSAIKRQKIKDSRSNDANEHLIDINKIEYNHTENVEILCYRYYNANERFNGRSMEEWLHFAVDFTTFSQQYKTLIEGNEKQSSSLSNIWDDSATNESYKRKIRVFFEMLIKMGIKYWTTKDTDILPLADRVDENVHNLDEILAFIIELQQRTGIKLLWISTDFEMKKSTSGLATNNNPLVYVNYGQHIKKTLDIAHRLGADGYLFDGSFEGYQATLVTDVPRELKNYAKLLKMIADYKDQLGFNGQLLFGTESRQHSDFIQYTPNAMTALCFLKHFNLDRFYKFNIRSTHEYLMISSFGNVNTILMQQTLNVQERVIMLKCLMDHGQSQPIAIIIKCSFSDETSIKHLIEEYVSNIDMYAKALRILIKMCSDSTIPKSLQSYYTSVHNPSVTFPNTLRDCEDIRKTANPNHKQPQQSVKRYWDILIDRYNNVI